MNTSKRTQENEKEKIHPQMTQITQIREKKKVGSCFPLRHLRHLRIVFLFSL